MKISVILIICFYSISFVGIAKQSYFTKRSNQDAIDFNYRWLDQHNQEQALSFSLAKSTLFDSYRNFHAYKADFVSKHLDQQLKKQLMAAPPADVNISFNGLANKLQIKITGQNQQAIAQAYLKINQLEKQLMADYLEDNYYIEFNNQLNQRAIKPDHVRFAREAVEALKPLKPMILETVSIQNVRMVSNYVLGFIQSIPYSTLESRVTSSGIGFNPPFKTLWENQGDCDSKVTLTAALFRTLMPRIKMLFVFIDNHALLAINVPSEGEELTINHEGLSYVLAEPTGPEKMLLGEVSTAAEFAIRNGQYYAEPFFSQ